MNQSPLIIIGMHRSGTSLITKLLANCGLFTGADKHGHDESAFFLSRNQHIFQLAHANWDRPKGVKRLVETDILRDRLIEKLKQDLTSSAVRSYLGWRNWLTFRSAEQIEIPWGWKDPRTSFTLPIWLEIFPEAKVLHIQRNGIDVAVSLQKREELRISRTDFVNNALLSCRCLELSGGFELWEEYEQNCLNLVAGLPKEQTVSIRYEDFLSEPEKNLRTITQFAALDSSEEQIKELTETIRSEYAYRFLKSDQLYQFYQSVKSSKVMIQLGYDQLSKED